MHNMSYFFLYDITGIALFGWLVQQIILNKKSQLNSTQLYELLFVQLLQININKKQTDDDWT